MKRFLALPLMLLAAASARPQQTSAALSLSPDGLDRVTVYTDKVESSPDGASIVFSAVSQPVRADILQHGLAGKAPAEITLTGGIVTVDYGTGEVTAQNDVTVQWEGHIVRGSSARYNWTARTGRVETVLYSEEGVEFRASSLEILPKRRLMRDVTFSGCGLNDPDYVIYAKSVSLGNNRRISARNVGLDLFHHRIVSLPLLSYRLRPQRGGGNKGLPIPRPGYSRVSGATFTQPIPIGDNLNIEVEATSQVGFRGSLAYANEGRVTPYVEADWKQERSSRSPLPILVSRVPEVGIRFGERYKGVLNYGFYRENSSHISARRATATLEHTILDHGEHTGIRLIVGARASVYSTHDSYRTARVDVSIGREGADRDTFEEIGFRQNGLLGRTPFEWDEVQVQTEAYAGRRIAWGHYRLEADLRYDVGHQEMYDVEVGVAKALRCVQPELRYSTRRKAVFVGMKILG